MKTRFLSAEDVLATLSDSSIHAFLDNLIERLRREFADLDPSEAIIPARTGIHYRNPDLGLLEWMPAYIGKGCASLKIVGYHPTNPSKRNAPTILSSIGLFDTESGHLMAMLDGTLPTAIRTGAMSAVATAAMTDLDGPATLGIIGCGAQSVTQAHALSRIAAIDRIFAYDIDPSATASLANRLHFLDVDVISVEANDVPKLIRESDILCTCTSAAPGSGPLFGDLERKPTLHTNAVGSDFPDKIELPLPWLSRSFVCPDFQEQALVEGECQQLQESEIDCDLSALLASPALQGQAKQIASVFDSTGHAFADYIVGMQLFEHAQTLGLGATIELESIPSDPKNPYSDIERIAFESDRPRFQSEKSL